MPPGAVLLVLGAALCHSLWNFALKHETRRLEVSLGALVVGTTACAPVLLHYPLDAMPPRAWALVLLSGAFETAYVVTLTAAYRVGDLSLVYPVARGTAPVLVVPLAFVLLGERPSPAGLLGILLVVAGILGGQALGAGRSAAGSQRQALGLAVLTGALIAAYSLVNKVGVSLVPVPLYAFWVFLVDTALLWLLVWRRTGAPWPSGLGGRWRAIVAVGLLMTAAYLAVLGAMALAPVGYVVAGREVSIVVAAALGAAVFGEPQPRRRLAGAAVIFAGLVVLALSR